MDRSEKLPIDKSSALRVLYCMWVLVMLYGTYLILFGITEAVRYDTVKETVVTVPVITKTICEEKNADGDTVYVLYVDYIYNGKMYSGEYYGSRERENVEKVLSGSIFLQINPADPTEQPEVLQQSIHDDLFAGSMLIAMALWAASFVDRQQYVEVYGLRMECINRDVHQKHRRRMLMWIGFFGAALFLLVDEIFLSEKLSFEWPVPALLGVVNFCFWFSNDIRIRKGAYCYVELPLFDKTIVEDEDTSYHLHYHDEEHYHSLTVSREWYDVAKPGDTLPCVFLEDRVQPYLVYSELKDSTRRKSAVDKSGIL